MKWLFSLALLLTGQAWADVSLPAILSSDMVLQQNTDIAIWGWANPTEKITVTAGWDKLARTVVCASDGTWKVKLPTPGSGGPYSIVIQGNNLISLTNILIGEVWICSGQSNMAITAGGGVKDALAELPHARNANIRFFSMERRSAAYPQDDVRGTWSVCDSASLRKFSAVGYFFGKKIAHVLHVPVGLIDMSWGGSKMEAWTPENLVNLYPETRHSSQTMIRTPWAPAIAGVLYNGMVAPVTNLSIAGVIWYQGESNRHYAPAYYQLTHLMVESWRKSWQKDFPFYYVQLAPYQYGGKFETSLLRENQTKAMDIPKSGMVVTTDLAENLSNIHPAYKKEVGNRLANWALAETYQQNMVACKSPQYHSMQIAGNVARLKFNHAPNGLISKTPEITEFEIAGADQVFVNAKARITNNMLEVWSEHVKNPVSVRFAFRDAPTPALFSKEGLPVIPFRTDTWDLGLNFSE